MNSFSKIAIITSGGDAPGINACIRAITKAASFHRIQVIGIHNGYDGMIDGDFVDIDMETIEDIIQTGGTILRSSRSERFKTPEGRELAYQQLKTAGADAVILIGGDGSLTGSKEFTSVYDIPWIGIPKTIDNDISGTDFSIGHDTATNTAMEAIDKIRDTSESHNRICFVEVMGRNAGFIAFRAAIATGAEAIFMPETASDLEYLLKGLEKSKDRRKQSLIAVVAEGDEEGRASLLAQKAKQRFPLLDPVVCVLGYIQRGGSPSCSDRVLASKLGVAAVNALVMGQRNIMVGEVNGKIAFTPLEKITGRQLEITPFMTEILMNTLFERFDTQLDH